METKPYQLTEVKGGWAAVGKDFAVFAPSRDEAIVKYQVAVSKHEEILKRKIATRVELTPV